MNIIGRLLSIGAIGLATLQSSQSFAEEAKQPTLEQRLAESRQDAPYLGDMYTYRNSVVPFEIYTCPQDLFGDLVLLRSNRGSLSLFPVTQEYLTQWLAQTNEFLTTEYLTQWLAQTNGYLRHLSGGKFNLKLTRISESCPESRNDGTFRMVITPMPEVRGIYRGLGLFWISPNEVIPLDAAPFYSITPLHELMHGLIGPHSYDPNSITEEWPVGRLGAISLSPEEATYLGWPNATPIKIHGP